MSIFNQNLVYLRESRGWKQREAALKLNVKMKRYQAWEEARSFPPPEVLIRICDVFEYKDIYTLLNKRLQNLAPKALG